MSKTDKETRTRKPKARQRDVVFGAIDERLACILNTDENETHLTRLAALLDELKRSLNGKEDAE